MRELLVDISVSEGGILKKLRAFLNPAQISPRNPENHADETLGVRKYAARIHLPRGALETIHGRNPHIVGAILYCNLFNG